NVFGKTAIASFGNCNAEEILSRVNVLTAAITVAARKALQTVPCLRSHTSMPCPIATKGIPRSDFIEWATGAKLACVVIISSGLSLIARRVSSAVKAAVRNRVGHQPSGVKVLAGLSVGSGNEVSFLEKTSSFARGNISRRA